MFEGFARRISGIFSKQSGEVFKRNELRDRLFTALIESDVSFGAAESIAERAESYSEKSGGKISYEQMNSLLSRSIEEILTAIDNPLDLETQKKKPFVIMFLGVNGGGKTTTIGKLAAKLKHDGFRVVLSASDTFRAGAIEQLDVWAKRVGVEIIKHESGSDPSSVAFDAISHATARKMDFVLVDTAGRMQNNRNLVEEMKKLKRVSKPDLSILILDAVIGQDAVHQGRTFMDEIGFDGIIITKLDTDAKGGLLLSLAVELKKPFYYIGVGQDEEDLMKFDLNWYISRLIQKSPD